jgi:hypothetical protein
MSELPIRKSLRLSSPSGEHEGCGLTVPRQGTSPGPSQRLLCSRPSRSSMSCLCTRSWLRQSLAPPSCRKLDLFPLFLTFPDDLDHLCMLCLPYRSIDSQPTAHKRHSARPSVGQTAGRRWAGLQLLGHPVLLGWLVRPPEEPRSPELGHQATHLSHCGLHTPTVRHLPLSAGEARPRGPVSGGGVDPTLELQGSRPVDLFSIGPAKPARDRAS